MVYDRDRLLKSGREITIPTQPLDPRDIFRGDYVTLGYDISTLKSGSSTPPLRFEGVRAGTEAYVTLTPDPASGWKVLSVGPAYPSQVVAGDVVLKGRSKRCGGQRTLRTPSSPCATASKPISCRRVPATHWRQKVRERKIEAILAVAADGTAALKGLVVDGERHVDPPLL